jgi:hypothetical protein
MENEKLQAVAQFLGLDEEEMEDLSVSSYNNNIIEYYSEEYEVLTDEEADDRWEEELDNYIEECIMPEIKDDTLRRYFDEDAWKSDARYDGRGHAISRYDGNENEEKVNGTWYYIYRQN